MGHSSSARRCAKSLLVSGCICFNFALEVSPRAYRSATVLPEAQSDRSKMQPAKRKSSSTSKQHRKLVRALGRPLCWGLGAGLDGDEPSTCSQAHGTVCTCIRGLRTHDSLPCASERRWTEVNLGRPSIDCTHAKITHRPMTASVFYTLVAAHHQS